MTWMATCDRGMAALSPSKAMYHSDMLVRGFLRHLLHGKIQVVLAGSAGTAILLNKLDAQREWAPNDIDFFVAEEKHIDYVAMAYISGVLSPLGAARACTKVRCTARLGLAIIGLPLLQQTLTDLILDIRLLLKPSLHVRALRLNLLLDFTELGLNLAQFLYLLLGDALDLLEACTFEAAASPA
ncbi:unnamed protein product, partial [Prorocentrum cordatum]